MRDPWGVAAMLVAAGAFVGCTGGASRSAVESKLRSCELLSDGDVGSLPFYAPTGCYRSCLGEADCAELEAALCNESVELLVRCDRRCAPQCGDGAFVGVEQVCDGFEHCEDGSDEEGCPEIACDDGGTILPQQRCDGARNCEDGSDEQGCPSFTCDDGTVIVESFVCNGRPDCADGSDEVDCCAEGPDCPVFECDGRTLPRHVRCDGVRNCSDGSDEDGCAEVTAMCVES